MVKCLAILLLLASCNRTVSTTINGSGSTGVQLTYQWRIIQGTGNILTPNSKISKATFDSKGTRIVRLIVTDYKGQKDTATMSITVR